jgi:hypothetical protein
MAEESSRLLSNSESFRTCSITKNSAGYTPNSEYCAGVPDTISDGDNRGRDPESQDSCIGTKIDIGKRTASVSKNLYKGGNEYCSGNA